MLAKTRERAYNVSFWTGSKDCFKSLKEIYPRAYITGNTFMVETERGLIEAEVGDYIVAADTMIMVLGKPQFDELFTLDF